MNKGLFISFEGVDGCGKSTQLRFLGQYLTEKGYEVLSSREPGGCSISENIRAILLSNDNVQLTDKTEALLYAAARCQHTDEVIRPAVLSGKIVLCDRFIDSSLAYQGEGRDLGINNIFELNRFAIGDMIPDCTFFLDLKPELCFERMRKRTSFDRLEKQSLAFFNKLYDGFIKLCDLYPERIIRINANGDKFKTSELVRYAFDQKFTELRK